MGNSSIAFRDFRSTTTANPKDGIYTVVYTVFMQSQKKMLSIKITWQFLQSIVKVLFQHFRCYFFFVGWACIFLAIYTLFDTFYLTSIYPHILEWKLCWFEQHSQCCIHHHPFLIRSVFCWRLHLSNDLTRNISALFATALDSLNIFGSIGKFPSNNIWIVKIFTQNIYSNWWVQFTVFSFLLFGAIRKKGG